MKTRLLTVLVLVGALAIGYAQKAFQLDNLPVLNSNSLFITTIDAAGGGSRHTSYGQLQAMLATNPPSGTLTNNTSGNAAGATNAIRATNDPSGFALASSEQKYVGAWDDANNVNGAGYTMRLSYGTLTTQNSTTPNLWDASLDVSNGNGMQYATPAPFYWRGKWFIAFSTTAYPTGGGHTTNNFGILQSDDFGKFTLLTTVSMATVNPTWGAIKEVWGPNPIIDSDGSLHFILAVNTNPVVSALSNMRHYEVHPLANDLLTWSTPQLMTGLPEPAFDCWVARSNSPSGVGNYVCVIRNWTSQLAEFYTSSNLTNGWTLLYGSDPLGFGTGPEAYQLMQLPDYSWYLGYQNNVNINDGQFYTTSTNLLNWTPQKRLSQGQPLSHGSLWPAPNGIAKPWEAATGLRYSFSNITMGATYSIGANSNWFEGTLTQPSGTFQVFAPNSTACTIALMGGTSTTLNHFVTDGQLINKQFYMSRRPVTPGYDIFSNNGTDNDVTFYGNVIGGTVGKGLYIKEGTNAKMGTKALNGTTEVTVSTTAVTANSRIFVTINTVGGTPAAAYVSSRSAGTSFGLKSTGAADTSTVAWILVEPSP